MNDYLYDYASYVLGSEERAKVWLTVENPFLNGKTPLELSETPDGADQVINLLGRIEFS